jgi:hypothetical protein
MTLKRLCGLTGIVFFLVAFTGPASAGIIYDNLNQSSDGICGTDFGLVCAQRFVTGSLPSQLFSVSLAIYNLTDSTPTVSIYSDDPTNLVPVSPLATLQLDHIASIPQFDFNGTVKFDATGVTLAGDETAYWVVLSGTGITEWSVTNCLPTDNTGTCLDATVPGDPTSAVGFPDGLGGVSSLTSSGTQQMQVLVSPEPSSIAMVLGGLALVLVGRRRR